MPHPCEVNWLQPSQILQSVKAKAVSNYNFLTGLAWDRKVIQTVMVHFKPELCKAW